MTDTCPNCVTRGVRPFSTRYLKTMIRCFYRCHCGHGWITNRGKV